MVPRPWKWLEGVQMFFEFAYKGYFAFLYKIPRLIHINLHLQYYIKKCHLYIHSVDLQIHGCS